MLKVTCFKSHFVKASSSKDAQAIYSGILDFAARMQGHSAAAAPPRIRTALSSGLL